MKDVVRNCACVTYYELSTVVDFLKCEFDSGRLRCALAIAHDSCEGEKYHVHFLVRFVKPQRMSSFKQRLDYLSKADAIQNTFWEPIRHDKAAREYLIHKNQPEKHQYDEAEVIEVGEWYDINSSSDNKALDIVLDIINGMEEYDLAKKYGRDYIINCRRYHEYSNILLGSGFRC